MANLPKLRIKRAWNPTEEVREMAQARQLLFERGPDMVILVEGQHVRSYEEMVEMVKEAPYKDKDSLEVVITPLWPAGG
ncbi:MAG: hypothetical protein Q8O05_01075 [Chloroflexota bacterium]|nr:hypothetical protein [Chloroflexota bacterium]